MKYYIENSLLISYLSTFSDQVAERAAENDTLVRAEANETDTRSVIATKIQNLKKSQLNRIWELKSSGLELEKEEETIPKLSG